MTAQFIIMIPDLQTQSSEVLPSETFSTQQNLLFFNLQVMLSAYVPSRQHSVLFVQNILVDNMPTACYFNKIFFSHQMFS